jgi:hypothetical protein
MLEPHLASTGATTNEVGITFLVLGAIFMVSTPLAGMVIIVFVPISPCAEGSNSFQRALKYL